MKTIDINKFSNYLLFIGSTILFFTVLIPQSEEIGWQHLSLSIASVILLLQTTIRSYSIRYKFDFIDTFIFIAYLYIIFISDYHLGVFGKSNSYTVQLFFALYFVYRIINFEHVLICLLAIVAFSQSIISIGQFMGVLESRHSLFQMTGTFLNPGPLACFLSIIGVILFIHLASNYSLFLLCRKKNINNSKKILFFKFSYYLNVIASIFIVIMLILLKSRSAISGYIIPIIIFILTQKQTWRKIKKLNKFILFFMCPLIILMIIAITYYIRPESVNGRLHIWNVSIYNINTSMFTGLGIGTFPKQYILAQENFYIDHGIDSFWVKYADTPYYAFNEYLNIVYEIGFIGLLFFIFILFLIIKEQFASNYKSFAYSIISILIISLTSYPLHLIPISAVGIVLCSKRKKISQRSLPCKLTLLALLSMLIFTSLQLFPYSATIYATKKWERIKFYSERSIIEFREEKDFSKFYNLLADNDGFLLDYAFYLRNKKDYSKSMDILKRGYTISNNPIFALSIAELNENLGNEDEAELYYKKTCAMVPSKLYPLYKLAYYYYNTKRHEDFRRLANYIIHFSPKITSKRTDMMKEDIIELLDILNKNTQDAPIED